jgi:hypothetical protein
MDLFTAREIRPGVSSGRPWSAPSRSSATPSRDDRLFPGDIEQFAAPGGGLGIAHGAAGVLYALSEAAGERVPEYEEWLVARAANPGKGSRLGLYDGLAGVAWTLARLGHADAARRAAEMCLGDRWERLGSDLHGGLAGFSLAMLALGDSEAEPSLVDAGLKAAGIVADRPLGRGNDRERAAGLLRGASGHGLLFVRLYERTGDPAYLDAAEAAIAADLDRCVTDRRGSLQVDDGWRILPYVGAGSAGIGMVIDRFLAHRPAAAFAEAAAKIRIVARSAFYAQAGLLSGVTGALAQVLLPAAIGHAVDAMFGSANAVGSAHADGQAGWLAICAALVAAHGRRGRHLGPGTAADTGAAGRLARPG